MELYILRKLDDSEGDYDVLDGGVVSARSEDIARQLISKAAGDEGRGLWFDPLRSSCNLLSADVEELVMRDFRSAWVSVNAPTYPVMVKSFSALSVGLGLTWTTRIYLSA